MDTLESTLTRLKIEDRIREANQRPGPRVPSTRQPASTPTAVREPGDHGRGTSRLLVRARLAG